MDLACIKKDALSRGDGERRRTGPAARIERRTATFAAASGGAKTGKAPFRGAGASTRQAQISQRLGTQADPSLRHPLVPRRLTHRGVRPPARRPQLGLSTRTLTSGEGKRQSQTLRPPRLQRTAANNAPISAKRAAIKRGPAPPPTPFRRQTTKPDPQVFSSSRAERRASWFAGRWCGSTR